jgi:hypothetical protein
MQESNQVVDAVEIASVTAAPLATSAPVEVPLEQLQQIAGGTPKGTW